MGRRQPSCRANPLGSGVVFVVLAVVAFVIADGPDGGASNDVVLSYFSDNATAVKWQALSFGLAGAFVLWFGGTLASVIRRAEGDPAGVLTVLLLVDGVVQALGDSSAVQTLTQITFFAFLVWVFIASSLLAWQREPRLQPGRAAV